MAGGSEDPGMAGIKKEASMSDPSDDQKIIPIRKRSPMVSLFREFSDKENSGDDVSSDLFDEMNDEEFARKSDEWEKEQEQSVLNLPAWFVNRMIDDEWSFAFLLVTGEYLLFSHIDKVVQSADGTLWIDVTLLRPEDYDFWMGGKKIFSPPSS
ncbi:hypothetical protein B1A_19935, partial [mine drainage metagenome]